MNNRIIWQDFIRNKAVWLSTVLFVTIASLLLSLAALLAINLSGSIDQLMQDAKTPHFMQMHTGEMDQSSLQTFAGNQANVEDFQVLPFLNLDNTEIILGGHSLADSVQDHGLCVQSNQFDFLLDLDNQPVQPKDGELYVPVCYLKDNTAQVGDQAYINGKAFTVAGFIRDSQMNSSLASSKRFVASKRDVAQLEPFGTLEYLIEFRLQDPSKLGAFETAYSAAGLPANGPSLTWPLFQMLSAVSDGIMIAVIVLIALLVILVALLCIRFTLLAKIEDDYREIGVMKAIGLRVSHMKNIYLIIYAAMAGFGSLLGFFLSLFLQQPLQESIRLNLGGSGGNAMAPVLGAAGAALVFLLVLLSVNHSLRRFRKLSAAQAIRFGAASETARGVGKLRLSRNALFSTNFFLAVKEVLARKRLYATMLIVVVLASFIMIVPWNLYHTISADHFVTYIGVGSCDLRLDLQQTSEIRQKAAVIGAYLEDDREIAKYTVFTSNIYPVRLADGTLEQMKVELGDHSVFPLQYAAGRMPIQDQEIALSAMNAQDLDKNLGEEITILTPAGEKRLTICGIYSDITNGGKTAKATFTDDSTKAAWSVICADLANPQQLPDKIGQYEQQFPYAKISSIDQYMTQTFGQTLRSVQTASLTAIFVAAAITLLVTLLFMKLLVAKDRQAIAVLRSLGFTSRDIRRQYAWRAVLALMTGILLGVILGGTLGEQLSALAISAFGATTFQFTIDPWFTFLLAPLILLLAALLATRWGTVRAGDVKGYQAIKE